MINSQTPRYSFSSSQIFADTHVSPAVGLGLGAYLTGRWDIVLRAKYESGIGLGIEQKPAA
ncbi:MAG: hypothetical protein QNJ45_03900 [Ardenticatenaceae bacterium]|nr:hypothetical protein [Ardenticatenaceae bacterium]